MILEARDFSHVRFTMLSDKEFRYDKDVVYEDENFLVFEVTPGDEDDDEIGTVNPIKKDL